MEVQERHVATPDLRTYTCPECKEPKTAGHFWHGQPVDKQGNPRKCRACALGISRKYGPTHSNLTFKPGHPIHLGDDTLYEAFPKVVKTQLRDWLEVGENPSAFYCDGILFVRDYRGGETAVRILSPSGKLKDGAPVPKQWIVGDDMVRFALTRLCDLGSYGLVFY